MFGNSSHLELFFLSAQPPTEKQPEGGFTEKQPGGGFTEKQPEGGFLSPAHSRTAQSTPSTEQQSHPAHCHQAMSIPSTEDIKMENIILLFILTFIIQIQWICIKTLYFYFYSVINNRPRTQASPGAPAVSSTILPIHSTSLFSKSFAVSSMIGVFRLVQNEEYLA